MTWSLSEAQALGVKAARGAGYAWGLAEEGGAALRWLAAHGLPGPEALAGLLESGCAGRAPCASCPLSQGAAIADLGAAPSGPVKVRFPLMLVPFAARLSRPVTLRWAGAAITLSEKEVRGEGDPLLALSGECEITFEDTAAGRPLGRVSRVPDSAGDALARLARLASRTYAPATEASRLAGAGAGTTDND